MSNIVLTSIAQRESEIAMDEMIKKYNDPELTMKGKREVLQQSLFFMFLKGYNLKSEEIVLSNTPKEFKLT